MSGMESNWLPFAFREVFRINMDPVTKVGAPTAVELGSFGTGGPIEQVLLQDFNLLLVRAALDQEGDWAFQWGWSQTLPMSGLLRYGFKHKGYLLEQPVMYGAHVNTGLVMPQAWNFLRPYRVFPGEVMRANFQNASQARSSIWRKPGMMFNGVRSKDERPHPMYSSANQLDDGGPLALVQAGFTCPGDSPVDIHGVSAFGISDLLFPDAGLWQVIGPDEREWFKTRTTRLHGVQIPAELSHGHWLAHLGPYTKLGEERGWLMERDETFIAEVGVATAVDDIEASFFIGVLTLRGSAEVTYG